MYLLSSRQRTVATLCLIKIINRRKQNKRKKLWIHPIISQRHLQGAFVLLYSNLREDERKFFNYFKMSIKSFNELHSKVENSLKFSDQVRVSISSVERLCVALR